MEETRMTKLPKRRFRAISMAPTDNKVPIFSDGNLIDTPVRNLTEKEKVYLSKTFAFIERKMALTTDQEKAAAIIRAMEGTVFLTLPRTSPTGARAVLWPRDRTIPVVYLNRYLYEGASFEEFAITVLHELMHHTDGLQDEPNTSSIEEARHDLECYRRLGVALP
jgi:hypothetical protein